jgi:hypothetical protein
LQFRLHSHSFMCFPFRGSQTGSWPCHTLLVFLGLSLKCMWKPVQPCNSCILLSGKPASHGWHQSLPLGPPGTWRTGQWIPG